MPPDLSHLQAIVVDAETGVTLDGPPTRVLYVTAKEMAPTAIHARHYEGEWMHCEYRNIAWHRSRGHDLRLVRVLEAGEQLEANR